MATVFGYAQDITGEEYSSTTVNFIPLSRRVITGTAPTSRCTIPVSKTTTTNTDGYFSETLVMGDYNVSILNFLLRISVPDDTDSYNVSQLAVDDVVYDPATPYVSDGVARVNDLTELRAVASSSTNKMAIVRYGPLSSPSIMYWDAALNVADDNSIFFRPTDFASAGMWQRLF